MLISPRSATPLMVEKIMRAVGWTGLAIGVLALYPMGLFATDDHVWVWLGMPPEVYPELGYAFYGIPSSILAILSGAPLALGKQHGTRPGWGRWAMIGVSALAAGYCLYLLGFALWAYLT